MIDDSFNGVTTVETMYADTPVLTTNFPSSGQFTYTKDQVADALTVSATISDEGVLSYQWYCGGEVISGATTESYVPSTDEVGSKSYSCQVTNTLTDGATIYLYGDVELPPLPEWDREAYPYAWIRATNTAKNDFRLYVQSEIKYVTSSSGITMIAITKANCLRYSCALTGTAWEQISVSTSNLAIESWELWANFDVYDENNKLLLAASEPIPVNGTTYTASATTDSVTVVVNEAKKGIHEKSLFYGWLAGQRVAHSRSIVMPEPVAYLYNDV